MAEDEAVELRRALGEAADALERSIALHRARFVPREIGMVQAVGRSVSRVGGKAQLPAFRAVAPDLRLTYTQYQELEAFARFGTRLEESTRRQLERGRRVREALKQAQYDVMSVPEQIAVLLAVTEGVLDDVPVDLVSEAEPIIRRTMLRALPDLAEAIGAGEEMLREEQRRIVKAVRDAVHPLMEGA